MRPPDASTCAALGLAAIGCESMLLHLLFRVTEAKHLVEVCLLFESHRCTDPALCIFTQHPFRSHGYGRIPTHNHFVKSAVPCSHMNLLLSPSQAPGCFVENSSSTSYKQPERCGRDKQRWICIESIFLWIFISSLLICLRLKSYITLIWHEELITDTRTYQHNSNECT